jgi:signal transduction histidine kinase
MSLTLTVGLGLYRTLRKVFEAMFDDVSLMPHAVCWAAAPRLIWTMVVANAITFLSYVTICATLLILVRKTRRVIARDWAYFLVGFALFIVACGSTHLMEVVTTWIPVFWIDACTNIVTAALSAYMAIMLIRRASQISHGVNDYAARLVNTEREKSEMKESLLAAQKLEDWSRMSAVLAHEINNPLETIQNVLYLICNSDGVSEEIANWTRTASDEATRVIELSRSTLSFFRQGAEPEAVSLSVVVDSVRFLLAPLIQKQDVKLECVSSGDVTVQAFPGEVRQVLLNLARNACEAMTGIGGKLRISLAGNPSGVEIVIEDQGHGIDPAVAATLFQFGASTKGENGNGMGLWTARHILVKHGGSIEVESVPEEGTRFTLWWPREYGSRSSLRAAAFDTLSESA